MNILITGGSGYLANRIGKYLSQNPSHNVILASQNKEYNKHRLSRFINWKNDSSIKQLCNGIDVIIHAAGYNLGDSEKTPYESINFSRLSMQKLLIVQRKIIKQR